MKMHMNMEERAEMGMLPGGSVKDLKVPRQLPAAGEFGYTSAKASDRASPPLRFHPPSTSHITDDADVDSEAPVAMHLRISGHGASLSLCSAAISSARPRLTSSWALCSKGARSERFKGSSQPASGVEQLVEIQRVKVVWLLLRCELGCVNPCAQKARELLMWSLNPPQP